MDAKCGTDHAFAHQVHLFTRFLFNSLIPVGIMFASELTLADLKPQDVEFRECRSNGRCVQISASETKLNPTGTTLQFPKSNLKIYQTSRDKEPKVYFCDNLVYWPKTQTIFCDQWKGQLKSTLLFDESLNLKSDAAP